MSGRVQIPLGSLLGGTALIGYVVGSDQYLAAGSPVTDRVTILQAIGSPADATARLVLIATSAVLPVSPWALVDDGAHLWAIGPNLLMRLSRTTAALQASYVVDAPEPRWLLLTDDTKLVLPLGLGGVQTYALTGSRIDFLTRLVPSAQRACYRAGQLYVFDPLRARVAALTIAAGLLTFQSDQVLRSLLDVVDCFQDADGLVVATPTRVTTFTLDDPTAPAFDTATDYPGNQIRGIASLSSPRFWVAARDYIADQAYPFAYGDNAAAVTASGLYVLHTDVARISGEGIVNCLLTEDGDHILTEAGPCLEKE